MGSMVLLRSRSYDTYLTPCDNHRTVMLVPMGVKGHNHQSLPIKSLWNMQKPTISHPNEFRFWTSSYNMFLSRNWSGENPKLSNSFFSKQMFCKWTVKWRSIDDDGYHACLLYAEGNRDLVLTAHRDGSVSLCDLGHKRDNHHLPLSEQHYWDVLRVRVDQVYKFPLPPPPLPRSITTGYSYSLAVATGNLRALPGLDGQGPFSSHNSGAKGSAFGSSQYQGDVTFRKIDGKHMFHVEFN